jgi:hypothetical protein
MAKNSKIESNGENFIESSYNEISILIREKDGFVNASQICKQQGRDFKELIRNKQWIDYIKIFNQISGAGIPALTFYQISQDFSNKTRGYYVHPELIHYVANWCNTKYALKVSIIMNLLNERNKLKSLALNEEITLEENVRDIIKDRNKWEEKTKEMEKEQDEIIKKCDNLRENYEEMMQKINALNQENENLNKRKVPDESKEDFTLMYYIYEEGEAYIEFDMVRRQTKNLTPLQLYILKNNEYSVLVQGLPISTTLNSKIVNAIKKRLPSTIRRKNILTIQRVDKEELFRIFKEVLGEEQYKDLDIKINETE